MLHIVMSCHCHSQDITQATCDYLHQNMIENDKFSTIPISIISLRWKTIQHIFYQFDVYTKYQVHGINETSWVIHSCSGHITCIS